jgi:succinylarginine dihydrolase
LLSRDDGRYLLVTPAECRENPRTDAYLARLVASGGPIAEILTFDLRQSMRNGGGPACLRLRVALTAAERARVGAGVIVDDVLADRLEALVTARYRDRLAPADLADPALLDESRRALDELTTLLRLPAIYDFQR